MNKNYLRALALILFLSSSFNAHAWSFSWPSVSRGYSFVTGITAVPRYAARGCATVVGLCFAAPRAVMHRFGPIFKRDLEQFEREAMHANERRAAALKANLQRDLAPVAAGVMVARTRVGDLQQVTSDLDRQAQQAHQQRLQNIADLWAAVEGLHGDLEDHVGRFEKELVKVGGRQQKLGQKISGFQEAVAQLERMRAAQQKERAEQLSGLDSQLRSHGAKLSALNGKVARGVERVDVLNRDLAGIEKVLQRPAYRGEINLPKSRVPASTTPLALDNLD